MPFNDKKFKAQMQQRIRSAIAKGLNQAGQEALVDIKSHVNVRSGRLRDTYTLIQTAIPDALSIRIDSPLNYKLNQYPHRPERIRLEALSIPALYKPRTEATGIKGKTIQIVKQAIAKEFKR